MAEALHDPIALLADAGLPIEAARLPSINRTCKELAERLSQKNPQHLCELVERVVVTTSTIGIALDGQTLMARFGYDATEPANIILTSEVRLNRGGRALRLIHANGRSATPAVADPVLVQLLVRAREWWSRLADGDTDIATIAREETVNDSWISRVVRLNFLAPPIVAAILSGTQPVGVTAATLRSADIPTPWDDQLTYFGM